MLFYMAPTASTIREMILYAVAAFLISVRYCGYHILISAEPQWAPPGGKTAGPRLKKRLVATVYGVSFYLVPLPCSSGLTRTHPRNVARCPPERFGAQYWAITTSAGDLGVRDRYLAFQISPPRAVVSSIRDSRLGRSPIPLKRSRDYHPEARFYVLFIEAGLP